MWLSACADDVASRSAYQCPVQACASQNRVCEDLDQPECGPCKAGFEEVDGKCVAPDTPACQADSCENGTCLETDEGFTCECDEGFELAELNGVAVCAPTEGACEAEAGLCSNGDCVNTSDGHTCACDEGYELNPEGTDCQDIDECVANPTICGAGGTCANEAGGYSCTCDAGYELNADGVCEALDPCAQVPNICGAGGTCVPQADSYSCTCADGYELNSDGACEGVGVCANGPALCGPGGTCVPEEDGYSCTCAQGYELNADGMCQSIGPCAEDPNICGAGGTCVPEVEGYSCTCAPGYELNSDGACEDINECSDNPGICGPGGTCTNTPGSHTCACAPGYQLNANGVCEDVDECADNPVLCGTGGICTNTPGGHTCACEPGYALNASGVCESVVFMIDAGEEHVCGIAQGQLFCWGDNLHRTARLGLGENVSVPTNRARRVGTRSDWEWISAGEVHTCGIAGGELFCWGFGQGRLGDGGSDPSATPKKIGARADWTRVSAGRLHTCGVAGGELFCWGEDATGQLGLGVGNNGETRLTPTQVGGRTDWKEISAGSYHTCGIAGDGYAFCWGYNQFYGLGDGTTVDRYEPTQLTTTRRWRKIDAGLDHSCAIGDVRAGGPVPFSGGIGMGHLYCWGDNSIGQIGDGSHTDSPTPKRIGSSISGWEALGVGEGHSCAIAQGQLYCWGVNHQCQIGNATCNPSMVLNPTRVGASLDDWHMATAANQHTCGIATDTNSFYCWGYNNVSQLGVGHTSQRQTPTEVLGYDPLP